MHASFELISWSQFSRFAHVSDTAREQVSASASCVIRCNATKLERALLPAGRVSYRNTPSNFRAWHDHCQCAALNDDSRASSRRRQRCPSYPACRAAVPNELWIRTAKTPHPCFGLPARFSDSRSDQNADSRRRVTRRRARGRLRDHSTHRTRRNGYGLLSPRPSTHSKSSDQVPLAPVGACRKTFPHRSANSREFPTREHRNAARHRKAGLPQLHGDGVLRGSHSLGRNPRRTHPAVALNRNHCCSCTRASQGSQLGNRPSRPET